MIRFLRGAVLALMFLPSAGTAQDFDAGTAAYDSGDFVTAIREWTPLAEQGNVDAQAGLGFMYASGQGVPQDDVTGYMWINLGAANGATGAAEARDALGKQLSPADLTEAQRRARVCLASNYQDCD